MLPSPWVRLIRRSFLPLAGITGIAVIGYLVLYWYSYRQAMRNEMSYHAEMERLLADYELRLRKEIAAFETLERSDRSEKGMTDHLLETLRSSAIASSSREVERARGAPESPDRRRIAMKWAKAAADEAAFMTELHRRWRLDYEHGREAHHITADEVKPFAIPKDGPGADAPSRQGERNK